jgi:hypothetical protein
VKQLSSSFSPAEEENSANIALSQDYFYGYLGGYASNQEFKRKRKYLPQKREKLFHTGEFRSWFSVTVATSITLKDKCGRKRCEQPERQKEATTSLRQASHQRVAPARWKPEHREDND